MLLNRDILIFGDDWGRFPSTIQHLAKILAANNRILWIGSLGLRKPKIALSDFRRALNKMKLMGSNKNEVCYTLDPKVSLLHPFCLPFHDAGLIRFINNILLPKQINGRLNELGFNNTIIITCSPITAGFLLKIAASSIHYICLDDYSLFAGAFKCLLAQEKILLQYAKTCFCVSEELLLTRKAVHGKNYFLPQGVDTNHFSSVDNTESTKVVSKVTVGFFGLIAEWIDLELISVAAKQYHDWNFVLIGKYTIDITPYLHIPNMEFIGPVEYNALPAAAASFTIGVIPFKINALTIAVNPLKLMEYFSLGLPVVSTALPEVRKFEPDVLLAENQEQFLRLLSEAQKETGIEMRKHRREIAQKYSWENIAESLSNSIIASDGPDV